MKNTTTEQKSLKNITTMDNITTIENTTTKNITTKITATALLLFLLLFTLTTNLKAQAVQDSESTATTSYEVTGTSDTTYIIADAASVYDTTSAVLHVLSPGIEALFKANCETGTTSDGGLSFRYGEFVAFLETCGTASPTTESSGKLRKYKRGSCRGKIP